MNLQSQIESILFVASKPLAVKTIAKAARKSEAEVVAALEELTARYNHDQSGLRILFIEDEVQMGSSPDNAAVIEGFVKDEAAGELTRAQLETLTVVAYRGPITRPELEQIRGVNCALIIRHLFIRGLIEEREDSGGILPYYMLSFEALRHLGISSVAELPEYEALHAHAYIEERLKAKEDES